MKPLTPQKLAALKAYILATGPEFSEAVKEKKMYRYCYHNVAYRNSGARHGIYCDPIKKNGKCIVGKPGNQFVIFEDGTRAVVVRRGLRLAGKCKQHRKMVAK